MLRRLFLASLVAFGVSAAAHSEEKTVPAALSFKAKDIDGKEVDLSKYKGKVILVVNVASQCGLTPQYKDLEALNEEYHDKGLVVLGFPCNQFGGQEPGTEKEVKEFCKSNYDVSFDLFSKIDVNGEKAHPFYKHLTSLEFNGKKDAPIGWNFEKFLIDRDGKVVARFKPAVEPKSPEVVGAIEKEIAKK
jgi:glutathione peroxidase